MKHLAAKLVASSFAILPLTLVTVNLSTAPANASTVIGGTGGPDLTTINGAVSDLPDNAADDFQLTQGVTTITDLHWWGFFVGTEAAQDNFFAAIFDNNSGLPGSIVASPTFVSPILKEVASISAGVTIYKYSVDIQPVTLSANTTYWLSINNDTGGDNWFWSTHNSTGSHVDLNLATGVPTVDPGGDLAFQLTSSITVPEPSSTLGFLALGILGAGSTLKRKLDNSDKENEDKD